MDFKNYEKKWRKYWEDNNVFKTDLYDFSKPKFYALDMFPYPSGVGLHAGHPEGYTATDIVARMKKMQGYNVLHPMGWDAFGLPAEQFAISTGNHPETFTKENIATFKNQLKSLGFAYDWDLEISTTDPSFYKWTQWIFKQLYTDGYAKLVDMPVNWCEELGTVLANDEVIDGKSERGGYPVIRKNMKQWVIDIPKFAEKLLDGLNDLDWPESTKEIQRNWIGKSIGAEVIFKIDGFEDTFTVFTTRADTLFGATYCVLSPEHKLVDKITSLDQKELVSAYKKECSSKSDLERTELNKDKSGVFTGAYAINPVNNALIPIWIADYVLASYGTGAIMAVPAHDERDYEFAKKFDLPIVQVLEEVTGKKHENEHFKKSIVAIVYDEATAKYLTINWKEKGGRLFIGGTINDNECALECAIREIKEETGYVDLELIRETFKINHHYYAFNKDKHFNVEATGLLFKLKSDKKVSTSLEEDEIFNVEWVSREIIDSEIKDELHKKVYSYSLCDSAMTGDGKHINSDFLNELDKQCAIDKMIEWLEENKCGSKKVNFRLREWIFARQRYWGEPIPIMHMENGSLRLIPDEKLPLILPELDDYSPKGGKSPLDSAYDWKSVNVDGMNGTIETSTMPGSAGSSWYYLRYIDPKNEKQLADPKLLEYWMPVDLYVGGPEHAVGHLLYSRMWNNYLYEKGIVPTKEPFKKLVHQGMILGSNGIKMGKRFPEFVVNPTDVVEKYGADTLRLYEMFMGPLEADKPWNDQALEGSHKFLERIYRVFDEKVSDEDSPNLETIYHKTVKKVTEDYESLNFNTAISQMMIFINAVYKENNFPKKYALEFLKLLNPIAPFITEEIWNKMGNVNSIAFENWPVYDNEKTIDSSLEIGVQINGKLRATINIALDEPKDSILAKAYENENVKKYLETGNVVKEIVVPGKIVNLVVK